MLFSEYPINKERESIDLDFRQTPEVCVNHHIDIFWTTHWCVRPIFIFFGELPGV